MASTTHSLDERPPWEAILREAAELLDLVPIDELGLGTLTLLNTIVVPPTNPFRGRLRDGPGAIWLGGMICQELPAPEQAFAMVTDTLMTLKDSVATGVVRLEPISASAEIVFRLLQAHPFMDGNGRVARGVANWLLQGAGYSVVSDPRSYCRQHKSAYYEALAKRQRVMSLDPGPWSIFYTALVAHCYQGPDAGLSRPP